MLEAILALVLFRSVLFYLQLIESSATCLVAVALWMLHAALNNGSAICMQAV